MSQSSAVQRVYQVEPTHAFFAWLESAKLLFSYLLDKSGGIGSPTAMHGWMRKKRRTLLAKTRRIATRDRTIAGPATVGGDLVSSL
jgi:hypothetical protein